MPKLKRRNESVDKPEELYKAAYFDRQTVKWAPYSAILLPALTYLYFTDCDVKKEFRDKD